MLDAIRNGYSPEGLPSNKPVVLVLTPANDALFNKWMREAEAFTTDCARTQVALDWLEIRSPVPGENKSGNMVDLALQMRDATRSRPMLLIAKHGVLGAALNDRDWWRRRALAAVFEFCKVHPDNRKWWCKWILGTSAKTKVAELLDLRRSTSVGQEGIDLHRECRHIIHHDLCWNPATIEQRTGRVDRIGSKVERERLGGNGRELPTLEIAVPYLAATYDERMFEELYRRAQLFEVTLGGDMRVEGRIELEHVRSEKDKREKASIGTEDEDLGQEGDDTGAVNLPTDMIQRLRVDLSVWKSGGKG